MNRHRWTAVISTALLLGSLTACGSARHSGSGNPFGSSASSPTSSDSGPTTGSSTSAAGGTTTGSSTGPSSTGTPPASGVPQFDHIVVVWEENHSYDKIVGAADAPYINSLIRAGMLFTNANSLGKYSEPNYLAVFSGSTQGLPTQADSKASGDRCPLTFSGPNLSSALTAQKKTFVGYAEGLPRPGATECSSGKYSRKVAPWVNFSNVTSDQSQPFTAFPSDYSQLPDVAFVAGNFDHDMHDGTVQQGDDWLKQNLDGYITWAKTHNSLLILTWDETAVVGSNHIPLLYVGAHLTPGSTYDPKVDHYTTLRTIEAAMGLTTLLGESAQRQPVTGVWS